MQKIRKICSGMYPNNKTYYLHENGEIGCTPDDPTSGQWKLTGAVRMNNFGYIVEVASFQKIWEAEKWDWKYKNGKQKWHITDFDHGTNRIWGSPDHFIV